MKKIILLACICLVAGCRKDEDVKPDFTADQLSGWANLGNTIFNVDSSVYNGPVSNHDSLAHGVNAGQIK